VFKDLSYLIKKGYMIPEILQTDWASILGTFGSGRCAMAGQYAPTWMPLQSASSSSRSPGRTRWVSPPFPG